MCHSTCCAPDDKASSVARTKDQQKVFIELQRNWTYVTVQQPSTGVVGPESDRRRSSGRYGDGIPSHGVLLLDDGRIDGCVIREVICRFTHHLELVTVQVERVETGVAIWRHQGLRLSHGGAKRSRSLVANLRVDDGNLNHGKVIEHQGVGHGPIDPGVVRIVAHSHLGE